MQAATIVILLILLVMGLITIRLKLFQNEKNLRHITKLVIVPGTVLGAISAIVALPQITVSNLFSGILLGVLSGESLYILYLTAQSVWEKERVITYYDDGSAPKYFITGDKHRDFSKVKKFCRDMNTRKKDVLIVLGDAGFNYFEDARDDTLKKDVAALNITLFCLHGNKECRPQNIGTYGVRSFCGGKVYYEPKYPNILFAIDGEVYTFEGRKYMVIGGAHSVDKLRCLAEGKPFWEDEMPNNTVKKKVEDRLEQENNRIYGMLTHTCPIAYLPTEMFLSTRQRASANPKRKKSMFKQGENKKTNASVSYAPDIDRSTEEWLGELEEKVRYQVWCCGHYHVDKQIDKVTMMYNEIRPLHM